MESKKICELVNGDAIARKRMVLTNAEIRKTKGNPPRPFAALTFSDGTGSISGNVWNYTIETPPKLQVYDVTASIGEYNGKTQLNNIAMSPSEDQSTAEFCLRFAGDDQIRAAVNTINGNIEELRNPGLQAFCRELFTNRVDEWINASSAVKMHHVGIGGNICHTLEVMCMSIELAHVLSWCGYQLEQELVVAGAILHDVGKLETYSVDGAAVSMTVDGIMQDHILIGIKKILSSAAAKQYPGIAELLIHCIGSHHGKLEYGSPVTPKCLEAAIINTADGLSANANAFAEIEAKAKAEQRPGMLTSKCYALDNSQIPRREYIYKLLNQ